MADLYTLKLEWPHTQPSKVVVAGTFDKWSSSLHLTKTSTGFEGTIQIPWNEKVKYKFIVDGIWLVHPFQPTEVDYGGFINNVYTAPPKPVLPPADISPSVKDGGSIEPNGHAVAAAENGAEGNGKVEEATVVDSEQKASAVPAAGIPQLLSDLANTIAARDGTHSALQYVASGIGAAVHSVVGVDPINLQKIAIPTPKPVDKFELPNGHTDDSTLNTATMEVVPTSDIETPSSPLAPIVPIMIVPVNARENNTIPASPPSDEVLAALQTAFSPTSASTDVPVEVVETSTHAAIAGDAVTPVVAQLAGDHKSTSEKTPAVVELEATTAEKTVDAGPAVEEAPAKTEEEEVPIAPAPAIETVKAPESADVPAIEEVVPEAKPQETSATKEEFSIPEIPAAEAPSTEPSAPVPVAEKVPVSGSEPTAPTAKAEATSIPAKGTASPVNASKTDPAKEEKPIAATNGKSSTPSVSEAPASAPVTPKKKRFPSFTSDSPGSPESSPTSSRNNSTRKKRTSILVKIKEIFHHDKEKEKEVK